ncbi:MAG: hypothetical protein PHX82_15580 [Paracoccaceae bacterium]|jgi:hypothetical protein|nr:hypothetical protein [Paracoccaceae bacterium]
MHDMPQEQLDAIEAEREKIFTPQWFVRLFSGRLAPGDTFWLGNYGILLWVVPALVMLTFIVAKAAPAQLVPVLTGCMAALGLYRVAILRAMIATTLATPGLKGWRWFGVLWTAMEATALLSFVWVSFTG